MGFIVYNVVTMFVDDSKFTRNGKTYRRVLLRNSYRTNGKVCHDTIANLSKCSNEEIQAIKIALKHRDELAYLGNLRKDVKSQQGLAVGAVWVLYQLAKRLGITNALGKTREATLALWLVFATVIKQGSRLSAVRLAQQHAACDLLDLDEFNEDGLYEVLGWLSEHQHAIEDKLFAHRYVKPGQIPTLYLYDVTSSYFEGEKNELAEYGYNRDGKKGKKQIVIGLMTDEEGWPICVEVFEGNTQDPQTVKSQIDKLAKRFGVKKVTLVGDRGMLKSAQLAELAEEDFHFITAITKPQIESLIKKDIFQLEMFDNTLVEVEAANIRYILRRNPIRAAEIDATRKSKLKRLNKLIDQQNVYLVEHPRAHVSTAVKKVQRKAAGLKIDSWVEIKADKRILAAEANEDNIMEISRLDGCYVIKSDLPPQLAPTKTVHDRYKGLAEVEFAFRTMKTTLLEMRGIFVRKANRTRAHVFVVMLAYSLAYQLRRLWFDVELTVEEGISELASICAIELTMHNQVTCQIIPNPRPLGQLLLEKTNITLPDVIPHKNVTVDTRKKLVSERKSI